MLAIEVHELEAQFVKLHVVQFPACRAPVLQSVQCISPAPLASQGDTQLGSHGPAGTLLLRGYALSPHSFKENVLCPLGNVG